MADTPPTSRIARTRRFGGLVAGQGLRWAGTRAANALRSDEQAEAATGERAAATARELVKQLGLNQPVWERFWHFVLNTLQGHLGYSWQFETPVATLILQRLWPTLLLMGSSTLVSILIGMWLGIHSGCAYTAPSTVHENNFPNDVELTFEVVSRYS